MEQKKYTLYFIGNINGNFDAFNKMLYLIKDYLWAGPASIFVAGNFGLRNENFLDKVERALDEQITMHLCGGISAYEGWNRRLPPEVGTNELRKGIYLHSFGSIARLNKYHILFLGHGQALPYEQYGTNVKNYGFYMPTKKSVDMAITNIVAFNPDIIVSYNFPKHITEHYVQKLTAYDERRRRLEDPVVALLSKVYGKIISLQQKKRWWFSAALGCKGTFDDTYTIHCVSLMPLGSHWSAASLDLGFLTGSISSGKVLGNLAYF